ncbi:MAG: hypothetical protein V4604_09225 [Bacteroidota bacterium]
MGHHICAIIGKQESANIDIIKKYQLAAAFENNYVIIILKMDSIFYWSDQLNLSFDSESEDIDWACPLVFFFAQEIGFEEYAIIQTNYFGGMGSQCASLYRNGNCILKEVDINETLKALGVTVQTKTDEFEEINLDDYRASEYYYWTENNLAEDQDNMIPGKVPPDYKYRSFS